MNFVKKMLNIGEPISTFRFISRNESGGRRTKRAKTKGKRTKGIRTKGIRTKGIRTKLQKRY
jgi:hypothetical protein